jgi:hypothetical protein
MMQIPTSGEAALREPSYDFDVILQKHSRGDELSTDEQRSIQIALGAVRHFDLNGNIPLSQERMGSLSAHNARVVQHVKTLIDGQLGTTHGQQDEGAEGMDEETTEGASKRARYC